MAAILDCMGDRNGLQMSRSQFTYINWSFSIKKKPTQLFYILKTKQMAAILDLKVKCQTHFKCYFWPTFYEALVQHTFFYFKIIDSGYHHTAKLSSAWCPVMGMVLIWPVWIITLFSLSSYIFVKFIDIMGLGVTGSRTRWSFGYSCTMCVVVAWNTICDCLKLFLTSRA